MIDELPDPPDPATDSPSVFSTKAAASVLAQKAMVPQLNAALATFNAAIASFNSALAGNAYAIPYLVDLSATADARPGAGKLRFNNATQASASALRADVLGNNTVDYTKSLDSFDAATSTIKGTLRLVALGDASKFIVFNVTARAAPTGYRNLTVAPIDWSSTNPFADGAQVLLFFQRNGDKGDKGDQGDPGTLLAPTIHVRDEKASGTGGGDLTPSTSWVARQLNTTKLNTISGASLASNRVTLPAGTYEFEGSAPAWLVQRHQCRLYNVTDSAAVIQGTSECCAGAGSGAPYASSRTFFSGRLVIAAAKTFELQHYCLSGSHSEAAGQPASTGSVEVYAELKFRKVA